MKIRRLIIENYKVFDKLELDFTDNNEKTINEIIIAGLNGCGKTTIFELIKDILSGKVFNDVQSNFVIGVEYDFSSLKWYSQFLRIIEKNKNLFDCEIYIKGSYIKLYYSHLGKEKPSITIFQMFMTFYNETQKEFKHKTRIIYKYSQDKVKIKRTKSFNDIVQEVSFNTHKNDMKNLIMKPIFNQIFKNRNVPPQQIIESEIFNLTKIFENIKLNSKFIDIESEELIFSSINKQRIKFEELSSGEKILYFMGFFLSKLNINNSIIIIDEPEDSLHPSWQKQIVKFYSNVGSENQFFLATHSPHIIGSVPSRNVFLLKSQNNQIVVSQPKYSQGHSIQYVLSEIMETDYRDTYVNEIVTKYLKLIEKGLHENLEGKELWKEIEQLDPNSDERQLINLSIRRYKSIGK